MEFKIKEGYYYLHINGTIIFKSMLIVNETTEVEYFDSPFVVRYWHIKTREEYNIMLSELNKIGVDL